MLRPAIALVLFATAVAAESAAVEVLSFPKAVARALADNQLGVASSSRLVAAEGQVKGVRGSGLPSLRVQFGAARSNDPLAVLGYRLQQNNATFGDLGLSDYAGPGSASTAPAGLNEPGYANNFNSAAILTVPLYAGGGDQARLRAAQAQRAAANSTDAALRAQLTYEVLSNYNGVAAAKQLLAAARAANQAADKNLASAEALFKRGVVIKSDVLTATVQVQQTHAAEQAALAAQADALDGFRSVIGAASDSRLQPGDPVTLPLPSMGLPALQDLAVQSNPKLQTLRETVGIMAARRDGAQAAKRPRVDFIARHDWNADTPALRAPSNTVMGVVTWNVFSSGALRAGVDVAVAQWQAANADLAAAENALRLDTAHRYRAVQTSAAQAQAARSAAVQANEAARLLSLRYEQGLSSIDSLLNAQARRDQASAQTVEAAYQAVQARAALLMAVDRLNPNDAVAVPLLPMLSSPELSSAIETQSGS
jgi:outer membrane protein